DRDVCVGVVAEVGPDLDQEVLHLGIDRVLGLGPVERDVGDPVALFVEGLHAPVTIRSGAAAVGASRSANSSTGSRLPFNGIGGRGSSSPWSSRNSARVAAVMRITSPVWRVV